MGLFDIFKRNKGFENKKDDKHPQWKFEYSGIIDFCESNLDEHLISIGFRDELLLDDNVQING